MQKLPRRVKVVTETVPQLAVGTKQTKISFNAEVNLKKREKKESHCRGARYEFKKKNACKTTGGLATKVW